MDYEFERSWTNTLKKAEEAFGQPLDLQAILFMIGVQELGKGFQEFSKKEKTELMHVAICRLLEPYGHYAFEGLDKDGWPHYQLTQKLPPLTEQQQHQLIKEAIIEYLDY